MKSSAVISTTYVSAITGSSRIARSSSSGVASGRLWSSSTTLYGLPRVAASCILSLASLAWLSIVTCADQLVRRFLEQHVALVVVFDDQHAPVGEIVGGATLGAGLAA